MKCRSFVVVSALAVLTVSVGHAEEGPRIEMFSPQGKVKGIRQVSARFSELIVPLGDPRGLVDPFDIVCPEKGTARWADGRNWVFDFGRDLPAGVKCKFSVKGGLKTLSGQEVGGQRAFSFSTGGPAIRSAMPSEGARSVNEDQVFILMLDGEATAKSLLSHVSFSIEGIKDRVGIRIVTGEERAQVLKTRFGKKAGQPVVVVQARQRFPSETRISLVWGKGVASASGVATDQDQVLHFETRKTFSAHFTCERENPKVDCLPITNMALNFSAPVSWEKAGKIVLKGPGWSTWLAERGDYEKEGEWVHGVLFHAPFPERSGFTIELPAGLKDDAERSLSNADKFPLAVRTHMYPPLAKFPAKFGILELNADPVLPITLRNIEPEVKARMLQIAKEKGLIGKTTELLERLTGKVMKVEPKKGEELLEWLDAVHKHPEDGDERGASVFGTLERMAKTKAFLIPKPGGAKAFEVVGIPLKAPGLYVVEIESAILGASFLESNKPMFVPTVALVTNLSAHFKWGRESSLVWVTTLDKAQPVEGAMVTARNCEGKVIWEGRTDVNGVARTGKLPSQQEVGHCNGRSYDFARGLFITAESGDDLTLVHSNWDKGIEPYRFQLRYPSWNGPLAVHSVLDRSLFRAGETVHMKHILRQTRMNGFGSVPEAERPKSVAIQHQGTWRIYELPLQWDATGVAETAWTIPKEAKLGLYDVVLLKKAPTLSNATSSPDGEGGVYSMRGEGWPAAKFRVEEFRVPLMKAVIQPPAEPLVAATEATVDLAVQYLAGGGAANLPVKFRSQIQPKTVEGLDGFEDFTFSNGPVVEGIKRRYQASYDEHGETEETEGGDSTAQDAERQPTKRQAPVHSVDLALDHVGGVRTTIPNLPKAVQPREILAELEFRDPNGETQTVAARIPLWPAYVLVGLKPDSWAVSKENLKFHVAVVNLNGKPVASTSVTVDLFEHKFYSHRKRLIGGFYAYEHAEETKRLAAVCEGKTDSRGLLMCETKSPVSGNVILQARTQDRYGNETIANREVWVAGKAEWWFDVTDHDRMDLLPERKRYEPGETAMFQVRMPFRSATVLVSVEREGVMETFVRPLSGKQPIVEVPIKGHYAPNVFVSVLAVRGRVSDVQPTALVDLGRPAYKLGIAEIYVGWKAHELNVKVNTDKQVYRVRNKAQVRITAMTLEGKAPPAGSEVAVAAVDEGLLELWPNKSWDLLEGMMVKRGYEVQTATAQMHVVGKRHFGLKAQPQGGGGGRQATRELFDTLLLWKGRVPLNERGEASVEIPLNDSVTAFRIVAVATGGAELFGTGGTSIRSTQDLMIFSGAAPLVRGGDRMRSEFTVRNATNRAMEVSLTGRVEQVPDPLKPLTLTLAPGEAKEVGWDLMAPLGVEALAYEIEAREKGGISDRIRIKQRVVTPVPVRVFQATLAQVEKDLRVPVERPADAIAGLGGIALLFRPSLADGLGGVIEYMKRYPYSCLEQEASRAVALRDDGRWKQLMANLSPYLDADGLAKYFPLMTRGSDVLTAYVLAISHEAGWEVPATHRAQMEAGLKKFVAGSLWGYSPLPAADLSIRKLAAIEALSRAGQAAPEMLTSIAIEPNFWPTSAVIDWFNILQRVEGIPKRTERMQEAEQILRSRLNFQGTTMGFSTERSDYLWWLMVSNDVNAVRFVLSVLNIPQWKEDMPRLVRGALGRQRHGAWDLTVANAWGVLAMEKFAKAFESPPVSGKTTVAVAGTARRVDWKRLPKGERQQVDWPAQRDDLTINHAGSGKPWVTVQSLAAIPLREPFSSGYTIKRTVTPVQQRRPGVWSRGDQARVRLEIEAQADMTWVVVSDPIPGGSTILGGGLGRDSELATRGEQTKGCFCVAFVERSFEGYRAYYEYVPKGSFTVEYTVRLNQSGTYQLPATRVEAMYSPEMFGEIPNEKIEVGL